jgi:membrane protein YdbS with pleckstrin-like domain
MSDVHDLLGQDEELELITRRHHSVLYRDVLAVLVALVFVSLVSLLVTRAGRADIAEAVAVVVVVVFLARLGLAVGRWRVEVVALTDRRVLATHGLLRRTMSSVPLTRITDVTLARSVAARMQRYGDVVLELGERRVYIERVPRARDFYRLLIELLDQEPRRSLRLEDDEDDTGPLPRVRISDI